MPQLGLLRVFLLIVARCRLETDGQRQKDERDERRGEERREEERERETRDEILEMGEWRAMTKRRRGKRGKL